MTGASFDIHDCPVDGDVITCPNCMAKAWLWQVPKGQKVTLFCNGGDYERGRHAFRVEGVLTPEGSAMLASMRLRYAAIAAGAALKDEFVRVAQKIRAAFADAH